MVWSGKSHLMVHQHSFHSFCMVVQTSSLPVSWPKGTNVQIKKILILFFMMKRWSGRLVFPFSYTVGQGQICSWRILNLFQATLPQCVASAEEHTLICDMQRTGGRGGDEEEEAWGTEVWYPTEVICLGSYRAYSHCWQSHIAGWYGKKEKMWEQHEKPAVLWL